ncbi:MAG TPA: glycosyltransferase family 39 protein [Methylomirabilota bacterium]|jgi:4-amino-4-deoxy-L-arabinose transferase-like glycosyltransferase|nr:glycosyltransferase family 39 protein [Methylomirabilota bacterium]
MANAEGLESAPAPLIEGTGAKAIGVLLSRLTVLVVALILRLWRLDQNGYDNEYYAAAVRSMAGSWHNLLYNSFDPAGFVSVDKPPVAFWMQVVSVKLLGFHGLSVLLPQVLEGVAAVWLVYHLVRRRFGEPAGLLAGFFLAITPVSVAIDRSTNTDTCLVLVLLLAAWALMRAAEDGSRRLLWLSMALIGVGFNVKMLAAFVVLPTFVLVYFLGAPLHWRRRLVDLTLAGVVLAAVSLPWMLAYDLTPPSHRPYAGSTNANSMVELAVGHNGVGRFVLLARSFRNPGPGRAGGQPATAAATPPTDAGSPAAGSAAWTRIFVRAPVGPLRLADGQLAGQVGWLFPLAVMAVMIGAVQGRWRRPLDPARLALLLWFGWTLTYAVVYSYAGGIFHFYYLATLAPPLAALAGIGVAGLWACFLQRGWRVLLLPATLLLTAAWQLYVDSSSVGWTLERWRTLIGDPSRDWRSWLHLAVLAGTLIAATALLVPLRQRWLRTGALTVGLAALMVLPAAWALSAVLLKGIAVLPSADLSRLVVADGTRGRAAGPLDTRQLVAFLQANRQGERYLLAASSTRLAAPIIIQTGEAVMARGGFHGLDPILTPDKLARLVEANEVRFVMLGDLSFVSRRLGGEAAGRPVADWIRANGTLVDTALWRPSLSDAGDEGSAPRVASGRSPRGRIGGVQLYDLRPQAGVVPASSP